MTIDDPTRRIPMSDQVSAGYEHQLGATMSFSADYVHVFSRKMLMRFDENKGVRTSTASTAAIVRPNTAVQQVDTFLNVGETDYDALLLQVEKRLSRGFSARVPIRCRRAPGTPVRMARPRSTFRSGRR